MAKHRRRRGRSRRRSNVIQRYFNPGGGVGGIIRKITSTAKETVSVGNAKKAGAVVAAIAAGFAIPARFLPQYDSGLIGIGLTVGAGAVATVLAGLVMPALVPYGIVGSLAAGLLKAGFQYARGVFFPAPGAGLSGFLTLNRNGMGQIPAGVIAPGQLAGFLTAKEQFSAGGPTSAVTMGGGESFSSVT